MPHLREKIDFTVEVFIVHKDKVLLRRHDKYKIWLSVGGHIEPDEDPNEAAAREAKEEVGLEIKLAGNPPQFADAPGEKELIPPRFINRHHISDIHEHVTLVYFATSDSDAVRQGDKEISNEIKWFAREELENPELQIRERIRHYALKALEES